MPIVTVNTVLPDDPGVIPGILTDISEKGAVALHCSPSNIWVMFNALPPDCYAHGRDSGAGSAVPDKTLPPVVIIKAQAGRSATERSEFVAAVADAVGRGLSMPAHRVWIHYQEMRPQDVWFEGHWAG